MHCANCSPVPASLIVAFLTFNIWIIQQSRAIFSHVTLWVSALNLVPNTTYISTPSSHDHPCSIFDLILYQSNLSDECRLSGQQLVNSHLAQTEQQQWDSYNKASRSRVFTDERSVCLKSLNNTKGWKADTSLGECQFPHDFWTL